MDTPDDILGTFDFDQFIIDNEWSVHADFELESESGPTGHQGHLELDKNTIPDDNVLALISHTSNTTTPPAPTNDRSFSIGMNLDSLGSTPTLPTLTSPAKGDKTKSLLPVCEEEARLLEEATKAGDDASHSDCEQSKYELRPQSRTAKSRFSSTWIDQDETGNYDPSEEVRKARFRKRQVKRKDSCFGCEDFDGDAADDESPPKLIPQLNISLKIASEAGKAKLETLAAASPTNDNTNHDAFSEGYRLRKRTCTSKSRHAGSYDLDNPQTTQDLPPDLTGHPLARGCRECLEIGHDCPLLKDEREWPCTTCLDDDNDCELITPPLVKRACERCKRRRAACSYSYTLNHSGACKQCADEGFRCVAGPAKEGIRTRIRIDRDWTNDPLPRKKVPKKNKCVSCLECLEEGLVCPILESGDLGQACEACGVGGRRCTIEHLMPAQLRFSREVGDEESTAQDDILTKSTALNEENAMQPPSPLPATKPTQPTKASSSAGTTHKIHTKFSHPIQFNYVPSSATKDSKPCHFCLSPAYPLLGLGSREVEVIDWADGRGLEEISGGHRGDGIESTRVCVQCTLSRLQVVMCPSHQLRPIKGVGKDMLEVNAAFAELFSGEVKSGRKWCAVCPSLAGYECGTGGEGCGLRLCEHCMVMLTGLYDGDLQVMLESIVDEPTEEKMLGLRADYELLKKDGLLMRYVLYSSQA